ncbi:hypothetical protein DACRYDRAFT_25410, partial [Dacryopinax primogenitus]
MPGSFRSPTPEPLQQPRQPTNPESPIKRRRLSKQGFFLPIEAHVERLVQPKQSGNTDMLLAVGRKPPAIRYPRAAEALSML